ncbi:phosphoribosylamine--glycine ligase-like [Mytilus galloprovincialis]|uniref:phosphoribosylamine--glycine ligase-like n=1 Tax=Mytilus galloprovincialis TaxID=29158 RepID=UPI003F7C5BDC
MDQTFLPTGILYFGPIDDINMFGEPSMVKEFFNKYKIPTPKAVVFKEGQQVKFDEAKLHFKSVIKTPSKTVFTRTKVETRRQTLECTADLLAMQNIVLEEFVDGVEISVTAFYNGEITEILPITKILESHSGAECPYVEFTTAEEATVKDIMRNLGAGLQKEGVIYIG